MRDSVPARTQLLTVVVTCDVETALERALAGPSRRLSRHKDFLRRVHAEWSRQVPQIPADLLLDTAVSSLAESVLRIHTVLAKKRD